MPYEGLPISRDITGVLAGAGDPFFVQRAGTQIAQDTAHSPVQRFNMALLEMLKEYQQLGTKKFQEAAFTGASQQAGRVLAESPYKGFSPGGQAQIRGAEAGALTPQITGAGSLGQTFGEQLRGFGDMVQSIQGFIRDYQTYEQQKKSDAMNFIQSIFSQRGSAAFTGLDPKIVAELEKTSGMPKGFIDLFSRTVKQGEQEELQRQQQKEESQEARLRQRDVFNTLNNLRQVYFDSGITDQDTLETASQKIVKNSKIYQTELQQEQKSAAPKSEKTVGVSQYAIEYGIVGLTESQVADVINKQTPPDWFRKQEEEKSLQSLLPSELQRRWDELRKKSTQQKQTSGGETDNPFR